MVQGGDMDLSMVNQHGRTPAHVAAGKRHCCDVRKINVALLTAIDDRRFMFLSGPTAVPVVAYFPESSPLPNAAPSRMLRHGDLVVRFKWLPCLDKNTPCASSSLLQLVSTRLPNW